MDLDKILKAPIEEIEQKELERLHRSLGLLAKIYVFPIRRSSLKSAIGLRNVNTKSKFFSFLEVLI
nr:hypothetical protein [uncultured Campylobacter sp.]